MPTQNDINSSRNRAGVCCAMHCMCLCLYHRDYPWDYNAGRLLLEIEINRSMVGQRRRALQWVFVTHECGDRKSLKQKCLIQVPPEGKPRTWTCQMALSTPLASGIALNRNGTYVNALNGMPGQVQSERLDLQEWVPIAGLCIDGIATPLPTHHMNLMGMRAPPNGLFCGWAFELRCNSSAIQRNL